MAATYTSFGPDPPFQSLPPAIQACIQKPGGAACDDAVGSAAAGVGLCADPVYAQTTYCACVNNAIPCPTIAAAACANAAQAYVPTEMQGPSGQDFLACKGRPLCINLVEVGGGENVVTGIAQQCGLITNLSNIVHANPFLVVAALALILALVLWGLRRPRAAGPRAAGPRAAGPRAAGPH